MYVYVNVYMYTCMSLSIYSCRIYFRNAHRAWAEFSKLSEIAAIGCLDEFMASDMSRIRNKAA